MTSIRALSIIGATTMLLASCGSGVPTVPSRPGGGGGSDINPNGCGAYAKVDLGRRLQAFLNASVRVQGAVFKVESEVKSACESIGKELGLEGLDGKTADVCDLVAKELKASIKANVGAKANLKISYTPAVCTVSADVAAKAAAECEANADANVSVECSGTCSGTCKGTCNGECSSKNADGQCDGECSGTCGGECSGSCEGNAEVKAEATCKASAEVRANAEVECTKPELTIDYDATLVADADGAKKAIAAIRAGVPTLLSAQAKVTGPMAGAVKLWARTAKDLAAGGASGLKALGSDAICVAGQLATAVEGAVEVKASVSVSVEASASVSGSAGAGS